jgi:hypothetical protein
MKWVLVIFLVCPDVRWQLRIAMPSYSICQEFIQLIEVRTEPEFSLVKLQCEVAGTPT